MLKFIPKPVRRKLERPLKKAFYFGNSKYCPVCKSNLRSFCSSKRDGREGALCPVCNSFERFRMLYLFIDHNSDHLFHKNAKRILHIAPEREIEKRLRNVSGMEYLSADLENPDAMIKMDITDIHFEDNHFDAIFCCHVLEHIKDDSQALKEMYRVLSPGGNAVIQVPGPLNKTFEDTSDMDPADRRYVFRHESHYHLFGLDLVDRMAEVGFSASCIYASNIIDDSKCVQYGVKQQRVFWGKK